MKVFIHNAYLDHAEQIMRVKDSGPSITIDIFGMRHQGVIPFEGDRINLFRAYYRFKNEADLVEVWSTSSVLNSNPSDSDIIKFHTEIVTEGRP